MKFLLVLTIGLALVVAACTRPTVTPTTAPAATATPTARPTPPQTPTPTPGVAFTPIATPARTPGIIPTPVATPTTILVPPATFFLRVTAPQNESVLTTAVIQVTGETAVDAVVSVNGQIAEVDATGRFQVTLTLAEGPNIIEVVASDFSGNQFQELEWRTVIFVR